MACSIHVIHYEKSHTFRLLFIMFEAGKKKRV